MSRQLSKLWRFSFVRICIYSVLLLLALPLSGVVIDWTPLYRETIDEEERTVRTQMIGPIFEERWDVEKGESMATMRPLWIDYKNAEAQSEKFAMLPPLFNYYHDPYMLRWEIFTFIQRRLTGRDRKEQINTFLVFPFFFYHDVPKKPENNYFGIMPLGGSVKNYFGYDRISWAMFPVAAEFEDRGVTRYGFPWPLIQWQEGDGAGGGGLLPIMGHYWKTGDRAYDSQYFLWPLIYRRVDQFDKETPRLREGFLPFYAIERGEVVDDTSILIFWGGRHDREQDYRETRYFWPFWVQGRGPGNHVNRWAPFYTHSVHGNTDKTWVMWPAYRSKTWVEKDIIATRVNFFYFLYMSEVQRSRWNPDLPTAHETHVWPFWSEYDNGAGLKQAQFFSPFEVFYPNSKTIRDLYTPVFAFIRYQHDENTGVTTQSVLWDFIREEKTEDSTKLTVSKLLTHDVGPDRAKFSLLSGLFGFERKDKEATWTLFWIDL